MEVLPEYAAVPAAKCHPLPETLPVNEAVLIEPVAVAIHVVSRGSLSFGDRVMITGGGPIGLLVAQIARLAGAGDITLLEINNYRIELAERMGFKVLHSIEDREEIAALPPRNLVFEVSGAQSCMSTAISSAGARCRIVVVGLFSNPAQVDLARVLFREIDLRGTRVYTTEDFRRAVENRLVRTTGFEIHCYRHGFVGQIIGRDKSRPVGRADHESFGGSACFQMIVSGG